MATTLGAVAVGSSVYLNVDGVRTEFLVVHQGLPDATLYDSSCDGTWLLMKDIYEKHVWDSSDNDYENSDIHSYLNDTVLGLFDAAIQTQIKQIKLPYHKGTGSGGSVASGSSGLSTKIFLLSCCEVGFTTSVSTLIPIDGAKLDYFESGDTADGTNRTKRIAYYDNTATIWWTRSPNTNVTNITFYVLTNGGFSGWLYNNSHGIRPALVLPTEMGVDDSGNVVEPSYEYTWVEYIESDGASYVDTGFCPNQDTRVVAKAQYMTTPTAQAALFGTRASNTLQQWVAWLPSEKDFIYRYGSDETRHVISATLLTTNTFDANANTLTIGANSITVDAETFSTTYPTFIFALNNTGSPNNYVKARLYYLQIYDNGTLVRDYVPAVRSDGTIGLYDKLNDQFYTNSGTGAFTAGPVVTEPASLSKALIGGASLLLTAAYVTIDGVMLPVSYGLADIDGVTVMIPLSGQSSTITFYFKNPSTKEYDEFQAERGMIWSDWIESAYNTAGISIDSENRVCYGEYQDYIFLTSDGTTVYGEDEIIEDEQYNYTL